MKDEEISALLHEQTTQRDFVQAMMDATGWSASRLAKSAGLAHTTVSRFLTSADPTHCLTTRTMLKLETATFKELSQHHGADVAVWPRDLEILKYLSAGVIDKASRMMKALAKDEQLPMAEKAARAEKLVDVGHRAVADLPPGRSGVSEAQFVHAPDIAALPKNFPVRGIAVGGDGGEFTFNGTEIDIVRRPLALIGVDNAFAVYVAGDSMAPRFEPGELLFVHPGRPPQPGDDVLVELHGKDGEPGMCYLKRLVRRAGGKVVLGQFNPVREIRIDAKKVRAIFKVLTRAELQ
ncbi:MAG: S24 family peptidase [Alphaproteobacteria bacterium]|jgi:phage repressor protein C with HTH and peptisase S24 domain|nr:S24 family peptidase [Alphaproteobacteria bacterium]MDP6588631.1 S24 family peptidase [Alphaproteobacteria bacterium]